MHRFITIISILFLSSPAFAWDSSQMHIRRFVGQWKGLYQVTTLSGEIVGSYPMEQSYYWMEGHLLGATAIQLKEGNIQYEFSEIWHDGVIARSIVETEKQKQHFYGWLTPRTIWWQSHFDSTAEFHQLHTEKLKPTHEGFKLIMDGYQWSASLEIPRFLHVHAELQRLKRNEAFNLLETLPE